ncbi:hypothetical protein LPJ77_000048 [Coemansia sp. RSA 2523]|nr:hypothetical protein LPJ54_001471 [Coemansia sp. RSA 1824]KAJ1785185.1 hypothetical protein LPJ62_004332 [Coemansia sp. RSA 2167]KAJ1811434.1 hypothetical protein LPJ77_000048 [Coemansia sp. RSA 2523]KAJ2138708.1 hypothetical protein GGH17_000978 [Coemansia sp. RSA 788]KAJ2149114.1 hypothetical protein IW142_000396 [Coemansia sp. RSA 564]KAJ2155539.1 hypothetical protein J3F82_000022 [Coemansia sp. RSA 637]KAJ2169931.1 hypothetical protein GGH15_000023 [Coemansia sp. RSA 562]KAJ2175646.1 
MARMGPQTQHKLYSAALESFPNEFAGISRCKFKETYIRNLKEFKQVIVKPCCDPEVITAMAADPDTRVRPGQKTIWLASIPDQLAAKYVPGNPAMTTSNIEVLDAIDEERTKSKDFWTGETNKPHDWKAILKEAGKPTSL